MALIQLETQIYAPVAVCFDLSRDIDLHVETMEHRLEKAIGGTTSGLIGLNETVTWRARHFGKYYQMTTRITALDYPHYLEDAMVKGPFRKLQHKHFFIQRNGYTIMKDLFVFVSPFGLLGKLVDLFFLRGYMTKMLEKRNRVIQQKAEAINKMNGR